MSLILPSIGAFGHTTAGGSGNYTFSLVQDTGLPGGADPGAASFASPITAGNLLLAICGTRNGRGHAELAVTDNNGKTWTKAIGVDNELANSSARVCGAVFWRVVDSSGETDTTPQVTVDDNAQDGGTTSFKCLQIIEIAPSAAYDWTIDDTGGSPAGTGEWDAGSAATASPTGSDIFELAFAVGRQDTVNATEGGTSFSTQTDGKAWAAGGANAMTFIAAFEATSQASGAKSASLTSDSSGYEGLVGIVCWKDGA